MSLLLSSWLPWNHFPIIRGASESRDLQISRTLRVQLQVCLLPLHSRATLMLACLVGRSGSVSCQAFYQIYYTQRKQEIQYIQNRYTPLVIFQLKCIIQANSQVTKSV
ncbi:hypothetical protein FGO68_gene5683 [Halteria grandinella]|uniref:Uncharacterized protein n=1 Tax=Halteria grandinella TaxID=5974 RepID=A0A8J8P1F6_HALGN|nr:hypothetical protein FGO68_gene5683 [Halteria grandinella]